MPANFHDQKKYTIDFVREFWNLAPLVKVPASVIVSGCDVSGLRPVSNSRPAEGRAEERPREGFVRHYGDMAGAAGWTWAQTVALLAGVMAVAGALVSAALTYHLNQRTTRRERQANVFAEALRAIEDYAELPYRIRRRSGTPESRHELTEQISQIQSRIAFHQAWLAIEAPRAPVR